MKVNFLRIFFLISFFSILSFKNIEYIAIVIPFLWLFSHKRIIRLNIRVIKSIILFNLGVSLGYIIMAFFKNTNPWYYVVYINLKVYTLTYFVFLFFENVSVVKFLAFSKDLSYLLTITLSQIFTYKKTYEDFRLAFRARVMKIKIKEKVFIQRVFKFFLNKAMYDSKERTLAMKGRGFFD